MLRVIHKIPEEQSFNSLLGLIMPAWVIQDGDALQARSASSFPHRQNGGDGEEYSGGSCQIGGASGCYRAQG
jgi:hypothetical protein